MISEVTRYAIEGSTTLYETREKAEKAYRKNKAVGFLAQDPTLNHELREMVNYADGGSMINALMRNRRSLMRIFDIMDGREDFEGAEDA